MIFSWRQYFKWAVALIVALALCPFFIGMLIEDQLKSLAKSIPLIHGVRVELVHYHRGWLHSTAQFQLRLVDSKVTQLLDQDAVAGEPLTLSLAQKIYHGPVIFYTDELSNDWKLALTRAIIKNRLQLAVVEEAHWQEVFPYRQFFSGLSRISFLGEINGQLQTHTLSLRGKQAEVQVDVNGVMLEWSLASEEDHLTATLTVDQIEYQNKEQKTTISELTLENDYQLNEENLWLGDSKLAINFIAIAAQGITYLQARELELITHSKRMANVITSAITVNLQQGFLDQVSYGPGTMSIVFRNIDVPAMVKIKQLISAFQQHQVGTSNATVQEQRLGNKELQQKIAEILPDLLGHGLQLAISPAYLETPQGELTFQGFITFPDNRHGQQQKVDLDWLISRSDGTLTVKVPQALAPVLIELLRAQPGASKLPFALAAEKNNETLLANWLQQGILVEKGENYFFSISYKQGQLLLNGRPLQEFKEGNGAGGRTRTDTMSPSPDFESGASTNFTTPAWDSGLSLELRH